MADHGRLIDADSNADGLWVMLLEVYNMPGLPERMHELVGDVILNYTKENRRVKND